MADRRRREPEREALGARGAGSPGVCLPIAEDPPARIGFVLRTAVAPESVVASVREVVRDVDPELPLYDVATLEERLDRSLALRRLASWVFALFGVAGLVLAAGGVFGVVSYLVGRRIPELGLRAALGASSRALLALLLRQGMRLAVLGTLLGALAALLFGRVLEGLLFDVDPRDPRVLVAAAVVLLSTAVVANLVPAARATRLSPTQALRDE